MSKSCTAGSPARSRRRFWTAAACLFVLGLIVTAGVDPAAAQQSSTATYDDWILQCRNDGKQPPQKICDIAQITQVKGKNVPFSRVAIVRASNGQPMKLVVQVPVSVLLRTSVRVQASDSDPGIATPFDRCVPAGCFAEFELREDVVKKFRAATKPGKVTYRNAPGQEMAVPMSFRGFNQAFDALIKQ